MAKKRDHMGPYDPFETLVKAGADPALLTFLCTGVLWGSTLKQLNEQKKKRVVRLRRADELRWKRFLERLRQMAREVDKYISNPAFDPKRLLPTPEAKLTLEEKIVPLQHDVWALVHGMLNLPRNLCQFAAHLDICLRLGTGKLSVSTKDGDTLRLAKILLLDYIEQSTNSPRYQTVAELVNKILITAQLEDQDQQVTPDDLSRLRSRNARLRNSPKPFHV